MAVEVFRFPLVNVGQRFNINFGGQAFTMTCRWNQQSPAWEVCFFDANTGQPLLSCLPLVTGLDLLSQVRYQKVVSGQLICFTDGDITAPPTEQNLGSEANLYYISEDS